MIEIHAPCATVGSSRLTRISISEMYDYTDTGLRFVFHADRANHRPPPCDILTNEQMHKLKTDNTSFFIIWAAYEPINRQMVSLIELVKSNDLPPAQILFVVPDDNEAYQTQYALNHHGIFGCEFKTFSLFAHDLYTSVGALLPPGDPVKTNRFSMLSRRFSKERYEIFAAFVSADLIQHFNYTCNFHLFPGSPGRADVVLPWDTMDEPPTRENRFSISRQLYAATNVIIPTPISAELFLERMESWVAFKSWINIDDQLSLVNHGNTDSVANKQTFDVIRSAHIHLINETYFSSNLRYLSLDDHDIQTADWRIVTQIVTEKTWKAMLAKVPFIIAGPPYILKLLKHWGFKTYSPFIDESYDELRNGDQRLAAITREIDRLSKIPESTLICQIEELADITEHNYNMFMKMHANSMNDMRGFQEFMQPRIKKGVLTMHILITGAGGFIGGHLVRRLMGEYPTAEFTLTDIKPAMEWQQPISSPRCRILDAVDLKRTHPTKVVFDAAYDQTWMLACDHGGIGYLKSRELDCGLDMTINTNTIQYHIESGSKKLIFASSACVYNDALQTDTSNVHYLKETDDSPANPDSVYGWVKLMTEKIILAGGDSGDIDARIARIHGCYGPYNNVIGIKEKAPNALLRKAHNSDGTLDVWGSIDTVRSFMYIDDCIEGLCRLANSDYTNPINIGSDLTVTIGDVANAAKNVTGKPELNINIVPGERGVAARSCDCTLMEEVLNFKPRIDIVEGLNHTYKWIKSL